MTRNKKLTIGLGGIVAAAALAWLAFGFFGIHTAFIDDRVNEANPFAAEGASGFVSDNMPDEKVDEMNDFMEDNQVPALVSQDEPAPSASLLPPEEDTVDEAAADQDAVEAPATPQIETVAQGQFIDRIHSGEGTAVVLTDGVQRFLRFEDDFSIDNGPDLNVYLVRGEDADGDAGRFDDDFIDLGDLKGNVGSQNYEIPEDVDLDEYDTVVIWCVRFGVAFNAADLT